MTTEEHLDYFLDEVRNYVIYWALETREPDCVEKLAGLAHSILTILDGMTMAENPPFERQDNRMLNDEFFADHFKRRLEHAKEKR
jgi:hypothetical protein